MTTFLEIMGVAALWATVWVVWRYTQETKRLAESSARQVEKTNALVVEAQKQTEYAEALVRATSQQNKLLGIQVEIEAEDSQLRRERVSAERATRKQQLEVVLKFGGGSGGNTRWENSFTNAGPLIRMLRLEPHGDFDVKISPVDALHTGGAGKIILNEIDGNVPSEFTLHYTNADGEESKKKYWFRGTGFHEGKAPK